MPSQLLHRTGCPLSCPSETGKEKETATRTRTGSEIGNGTEERQGCGTCGRRGRERCNAGSELVASASGTGTKSGNLRDQEKKDDDLDPETESGGGGRGPRARKGRQIRRVMHKFTKIVAKVIIQFTVLCFPAHSYVSRLLGSFV